jgi:NAD(P)-dependent dehydrogenase (short-subunit alcohol dehydrogenase family)
MQRFAGKVVVITGAASGIGRATALRIASEGGTIALLDVQPEGLAETRALIEKKGARAECFACDVSDPKSARAALSDVVARLGGFHALCNIAGILRVEETHETTPETWNRVLAVNLTGTFFMCQAAIGHLLETKGAIVNVASTAALGGHPWMAAYAASKGGVLALTKALACEYAAKGLRVNAIVPGGFKTPMVGAFERSVTKAMDLKLLARCSPLVGMAEPEDCASVIAFLASDDARYMHGTEVIVDGGAMS